MKKGILSLIVIVLILAAVMVFNTMKFTAPKPSPGIGATEPINGPAAAKRLSAAVQFKTISHQDPAQMDPAPFRAFREFIRTAYPLISQELEIQVINTHSLVYKWKGKNPDLKPMALLAHYDVVPVAPGTEKDWMYPPFSGTQAEGFIWGRGTMDMKGTFMAILESVNALVHKGFSPERTIYLAFGHDEEVGGENGARKIADFLDAQGIRLSFTLDEGMVVLDENLSPSKKNLAVIGVAEKGYVTLEITARGKGGHSSMPDLSSPIGVLGRAAHRLEASQMPATLSGPVGMLFDHIGPDLPFVQKLLFANQWAFKPLILKVLEQSKTTNAMIRTTTALTMINGGIKENVLPDRARLLVNFRILPGNGVEDVLTHAKSAIDDENVEISVYNDPTPPSPVAKINTPAFFALKETVGQIFPGIAVTPGLVLAGTDSKHYVKIADNCYRFAPFIFGPKDPARIHGTNERVFVENYLRAIQYYIQLIKNGAGKRNQ